MPDDLSACAFLDIDDSEARPPHTFRDIAPTSTVTLRLPLT
jgi:hypothetical protein